MKPQKDHLKGRVMGVSFRTGMVLCTACLFLIVPHSGGWGTKKYSPIYSRQFTWSILNMASKRMGASAWQSLSALVMACAMTQQTLWYFPTHSLSCTVWVLCLSVYEILARRLSLQYRLKEMWGYYYTAASLSVSSNCVTVLEVFNWWRMIFWRNLGMKCSWCWAPNS
jgi:hypothetical protein